MRFPRRQPVIADRPPPRVAADREKLEPGRVCAVFGPRRVGVSVACRVVHAATETPTALVVATERAAIMEAVELERERGQARVIFLDGMPRTVDDVQWLYDERLVAPAFGGCLVRLHRNAIIDREFDANLVQLEARIRMLVQPYSVVHTDDAEYGCAMLLLRCGVTR